MGPNAFRNGMPDRMMTTDLDPFSMALAQPNLYSGLQPLAIPFMMSNTMYMGFDTPQPGFVPTTQGFPVLLKPNTLASGNFQQPYGNTAPSQEQDTVSSIPYNPPQDTSGYISPQRRVRIRSLPPTGPEKSSGERNRHRDEISAPSAASGGVPEPTAAYTMRASFLPKRRPHPGPLLVVIDLNGTILHRPNRKNPTSFQARRHAHQFINYCVNTFWVVIWSSARPENVRPMVAELISSAALKQVVAVWGRDRFGLTSADYGARTQCYKRLTKLWDDPLVKSSYPRTREGFKGGSWGQGNTVLIDDSAEKARSEPHNAITLPEFKGDMDEAWDVLPMVHDYLNELCYQEDVSAYLRANPFKIS